MTDLDKALEYLGFDKVPHLGERVRLLKAIREFGIAASDAGLSQAAHDRIPVADPTVPPETWLSGFCLGYEIRLGRSEMVSNQEVLSSLEAAHIVWQMMSDEWRQARMDDSFSRGARDGEDEASMHRAQTVNALFKGARRL